MPIQSTCSGCGQTLRVADEHLGKLAKCPSCGTVYRVGETSAPSATTPPQSPNTPSSDPFAVTEYAQEPTTEFPAVAHVPSDSTNATLRSKTFFAQTPDGKVYGPSDYTTLEKWCGEGRLNAQCMVREIDEANWRPLSSVVNQLSSNPYGVQYAAANGNMQSSAVPQSDRSVVVLTLGIISWIICCFGPICAIVAIVLGYQDLNGPNTATMNPSSKTMTQVGFYLAIANLVAYAIGTAISMLSSFR